MPTASQCKILSKLGEPIQGKDGRAVSARQLAKQYMEDECNIPEYVPPVPMVFSIGGAQINLERLKAAHKNGDDKTFFPEMVKMSKTLVEPGATPDNMTADDIMKRLYELGWRKEGDAERCAEERRKREEEKRIKEEEEAAKRHQVLDIINDPLLRRVKDKNDKVFVPKYSRAPDSRPCAVCFDYIGPSVAHSTVKMKMDELMDGNEDNDVKILAIEFQPRSMHVKGKNIGNRWVITVNSQFAVAQLNGNTLKFGKQVCTLKSYDEVLGGEFHTFTKQTSFMTRMFSRGGAAEQP